MSNAGGSSFEPALSLTAHVGHSTRRPDADLTHSSSRSCATVKECDVTGPCGSSFESLTEQPTKWQAGHDPTGQHSWQQGSCCDHRTVLRIPCATFNPCRTKWLRFLGLSMVSVPFIWQVCITCGFELEAHAGPAQELHLAAVRAGQDNAPLLGCG